MVLEFSVLPYLITVAGQTMCNRRTSNMTTGLHIVNDACNEYFSILYLNIFHGLCMSMGEYLELLTVRVDSNTHNILKLSISHSK